MASRNFVQFRYSLERAVVDLFGRVTFGASQTPTLVAADSKGFDTVVKINTTTFLVALQDAYIRNLAVGCEWLQSGIYADGTNHTGAGAVTIAAPNASNSTWMPISKVTQNSLGVVTCASVTAGNTLTVDGVTFTAIANGAGTSTTKQFEVGTGGTANADTANALAATINAYSAANASWGVNAATYGALLILWSPRAQVLWAVFGGTMTLSSDTKMSRGGFIIVTSAAPNSGDEMRFNVSLSNSGAV